MEIKKIQEILNGDLSKSTSKAAKAVDKVFGFLSFVTQMKILCLITCVYCMVVYIFVDMGII